MAKIVHNACFGGFGLSDAAIRRYAEIKGLTLYPEDTKFGFKTWWTVPPAEREGKILDDNDWFSAPMEVRQASNDFYRANTITERDIPRFDLALVQTVEELGDAANGHHAKLRIAEVPSGERYRIDEYDGSESIETVDSYDWSIAP